MQRGINLEIMDMAQKQYGISPLPHDTVAAMAYVPFQKYDSETYTPEQGLVLGTMYPELHKPFYGQKCGAHSD